MSSPLRIRLSAPSAGWTTITLDAGGAGTVELLASYTPADTLRELADAATALAEPEAQAQARPRGAGAVRHPAPIRRRSRTGAR